MTQRLKYVDIAKGFAIFLMVLGHTHQSNNWDVLPNGASLTQWIYSFHMPFFFFVAGFTFTIKILKSKVDWLEWFEKIIQRYFVPYMFMMLLSDGFSIEKLKDYLCVEMWRLCKYTPLASWWLPCFIVLLLIAQIFVQVLKNPKKIIIALLMLFPIGLLFDEKRLGDQPFFWNIAVIGGAFLGIGMLARQLGSFIGVIVKTRISEKKYLLTIFLGAITVFLILSFTYKMNSTVYMVIGRYGNPILFLVNGLLGCCLLMMVAKFCEQAPPLCLFSILGRYSIIVMMFHHWFIMLCNKIVYRFVSEQDGNVWIRIGQTVCEIILCFPFIWFVDRFCPNIFGKRKIQ